MIKAVVFDLDDTLYPEIQYVQSGFRAVAEMLKAQNGIDYYDEIVKLFETERENVFDRLISSRALSTDKDLLLHCFREHEPKNLGFYEDVMPCLKMLQIKQIRTGIITDGRISGQTAKLNALHCFDLFDQCLITDSLGGIEYRKPHPLSYERIAAYLNVQFSEMMYVGDNPKKDFEIRKRYPIITVRIDRGDGLYRLEHVSQADTICYSIDSLNQLFDILEIYE